MSFGFGSSAVAIAALLSAGFFSRDLGVVLLPAQRAIIVTSTAPSRTVSEPEPEAAVKEPLTRPAALPAQPLLEKKADKPGLEASPDTSSTGSSALPFLAGAAVAAAGVTAVVLLQGRARPTEVVAELCPSFEVTRGRSPARARKAGTVADSRVLDSLASAEYRRQ